MLTVYIPRQIKDKDGTNSSITKGQKLKFELLLHDEKVMIQKGPRGIERLRSDKDDYFTNIPWSDGYIWEVTVTQDIEYKAGDYINGDLSDPKNSYSVPRVALNMGLPFKLSAYLFEATEPAN